MDIVMFAVFIVALFLTNYYLKYIYIYIYICSPAGRSVLEKLCRGLKYRTQDRGHSFFQYGPTQAGENLFIFFNKLNEIPSKRTQ